MKLCKDRDNLYYMSSTAPTQTGHKFFGTPVNVNYNIWYVSNQMSCKKIFDKGKIADARPFDDFDSRAFSRDI